MSRQISSQFTVSSSCKTFTVKQHRWACVLNLEEVCSKRLKFGEWDDVCSSARKGWRRYTLKCCAHMYSLARSSRYIKTSDANRAANRNDRNYCENRHNSLLNRLKRRLRYRLSHLIMPFLLSYILVGRHAQNKHSRGPMADLFPLISKSIISTWPANID